MYGGGFERLSKCWHYDFEIIICLSFKIFTLLTKLVLNSAISMETLTQIESKISNFSEQELSDFREWFYEFDNKRWDDKLKKDILGGKLENLALKALNEFANGQSKSI